MSKAAASLAGVSIIILAFIHLASAIRPVAGRIVVLLLPWAGVLAFSAAA
jgi:hypothetical protein